MGLAAVTIAGFVVVVAVTGLGGYFPNFFLSIA